MQTSSRSPQSPCVGICTLDAITKLCLGCHRNTDEIAGWSRYTARQKLQILERVAERQALARGSE